MNVTTSSSYEIYSPSLSYIILSSEAINPSIYFDFSICATLKDQKFELIIDETLIRVSGNLTLYGSNLNKNISNGSGIFTVYTAQVGMIKITAYGSGIYGYMDLLINSLYETSKFYF